VFHFTPTSSSWANAVETFFASLSRRRLQRGVFRSLVDLQAAINRHLGERSHKPKPFLWTADPDHIIEKINRGYPVLASDQLARISHTGRCIGVLILRKSCCDNGLSQDQGSPDADRV